MLIDAFAGGDIDPGWNDFGDGNFGTLITTRKAAEEAGAEGWPSPSRDTE
ncbi:hypothetical protein P0W64_21225 [Tsukamurella sp. 8F]|nr:MULTISPECIES: hypothetical protein [unclassified Tsukamurella]MDF0532280.1 hypothetical protein [Tsukamurella sp. 8J]MDF0589306.1 hypothetical protein [Tsukamurella sp. 8F]